MANYAVWWLGVGAVGMYGYATGRISNFIDNYKNKDIIDDNNKNNNNNNNLQQERRIIVESVNNNGGNNNSYLIPISFSFIFGITGYYYFINSSSTKKVIGRVEKTAKETQNLVQETDENNTKRFEILDKKNENRAQNLEIEIKNEQRTGFNVISEQLYCLQQVAIQTLNAVASLSLSSSSNNNDNDNNNEKLLGYCDKAQEMADTILSDKHILKTKENNLKDIKAEIQLRNNNNHTTTTTPGGGDDNNSFYIKQNQSLPSCNNKKIENRIKPFEIGHYIWNNKQYFVLATGTISVFYITNKVNGYIFNSNNYKNNDD